MVFTKISKYAQEKNTFWSITAYDVYFLYSFWNIIFTNVGLVLILMTVQFLKNDSQCQAYLNFTSSEPKKKVFCIEFARDPKTHLWPRTCIERIWCSTSSSLRLCFQCLFKICFKNKLIQVHGIQINRK